jgi:hypothetical protein
MRETFKLPSNHNTVKRIISTTYGKAGRKPVRIECKKSVSINDLWDGGSRTEAIFLCLKTLTTLPSTAIPNIHRQIIGNPFNQPIGVVNLSPGYAVVEHSIFCGRDCGYTIIMHPDDILIHLPEAKSLIPVETLPNLSEDEIEVLIDCSSEVVPELSDKF